MVEEGLSPLRALDLEAVWTGAARLSEEAVMATKIFLALIAAGLWANAIVSFTQPLIDNQRGRGPARADDTESYLSNIEHDIHGLWNGNCMNPKLC
jgi:hypothetical protein